MTRQSLLSTAAGSAGFFVASLVVALINGQSRPRAAVLALAGAATFAVVQVLLQLWMARRNRH